MKLSAKKILVITPVNHINNVKKNLKKLGKITYLNDPSKAKVLKVIHSYDAIFTNPNKSKVFIDKTIMDKATKLKVICTASTGTNHIDKLYAKEKGIHILSLTNERKVINLISSTAELAFALTMASIRNLIPANKSVHNGEWNYEPFVGRQANCLTFGVIGYGRLGSMYANFCKAFNPNNILVFDPYKTINDKSITQVNDIRKLVELSDVISIHVHVSEETINLINSNLLKYFKANVILINTSRGEIINEKDLINFLKKNKEAKVGVDVLNNEIKNRDCSELLKFSKSNPDRVLITPHIGGMTMEAQEIAYNHAVMLLSKYLK